MKKLLEAMDSMAKAEAKPTGPKFPGYWKGTDSAGKSKSKMVGSAEESIIKELNKAAKDTVIERELTQQYKKYNDETPVRIADKLKAAYDVQAGTSDEINGITRRKETLRQKLQKHREKGLHEGGDGVDTVTMDVPLMIRMLEYAREDAQTDMDLHNVAERMIELSQEDRPLTMHDYDTICGTDQLKEYGNAQNPDAQTTTPGAAGAAQADAQNDAGASADLATTQKNLSKLKAVDPTLNPQLANQALQTIDKNPAATVGGGQLKQTQGLADLVGDALADPQRGSQLATILQQVQQAKKVK